MKQKRFFIGVAMAFLVGVMAAFPLFHDSQEPFSGEMPRDKDIDQQSDEAPSALLKITQMSEPVLLGKTGQAAGEVAYSFSVEPLTSGIKHISFLSGNPDVKFVEYVLLPEDDSDNVEEGFAENRVLRHPSSFPRMGPFPAMQQNGWKPRWKERLPAGRKWKSIWSSR